jgi:dolichol-phosphate mannosyltransferase
MISVIVPTYQEAANLQLVAKAVDEALSGSAEPYELLFIDDDSQDGSEAICEELAQRFPVQIVVRKEERGLATAVIHGIEVSSGDIVVVMDADLSHPPSAIPGMIERLRNGQNDFVLGSRYVEGGSIHGFFAFHRRDMPESRTLSPIGYKIALEIYVKGDFDEPSEVPIHFADRQHGESKLSVKQQLNFVRHLGRLYAYKLRANR